jgi:RNA polymerase sigma-70 factor (ECF subfamily)
VVQSSRSQPPPAPDHRAGGRLLRSLEDRLVFRRAQGLLAGLAGCGQQRAARSLRTTAEQLDLDAATVARRFLDAVEAPDGDAARPLLLRIALAASLPEGPASGQPSVVAGPGGVTVRGGLDAESAPLLGAAAVVRPARSGEPFVVDLAGLTNLDSAGLCALDALASRVRDGGSVLRVVAPLAPGRAPVLGFAVSLRWLPPAFGTTSTDGTQPAPALGASALLAELELLYDSHASACWSLAHRMLRDDAEAEAVVLAAFVESWQHLASDHPLRGGTRPQLLQRTHRLAVLRLRERQDDPDPSVPRGGRQRSSRRPATSADGLTELPRDEAQALRLAFWQGLTVQQIAATTGTPLADVRASMLAGVRSLSRAREDRR